MHAQSCPTLCDPMGNPPDSSVNGIFQARILEWVANSSPLNGLELNNSSESGQLCLVPGLRGNAFSFSPLKIMLAVGLSYMTFIMLR